VRNRYQTKWNDRVVDIMDLDLFTTYDLDAETDAISHYGMKSEFNFASWFQVFMDGDYDAVAGLVDVFNARARVRGEQWTANVEHRYRDSDSSLLAADIAYAPNKAWSFGIYDRYEFETSQLEEQGIFVTRTLDCLGIRLGGSYLPGYTSADGATRDDDFRATIQLWLTAFPNVRIGSAPRD